VTPDGDRNGTLGQFERAVLSRRTLMLGGLAMIPAVVAACRSGGDAGGAGATTTTRAAGGATGPGTTLAPTPACGDDDEPTAAQTEGPFYTPNSPEKTSFLGDVQKGMPMVLAGSVLTTACQPVARARLDVWHSDDEGNYDNEGHRLRGHLFTDAQGRYRLETIVPGLYSGRTRHLHVKVQAGRSGRVLTTQLYFPGEAANDRDGIYRPELLMEVREVGGRKDATFDFVVEA
jgi:protocatechuate 3,4-dioxygenase beta subunit